MKCYGQCQKLQHESPDLVAAEFWDDTSNFPLQERQLRRGAKMKTCPNSIFLLVSQIRLNQHKAETAVRIETMGRQTRKAQHQKPKQGHAGFFLCNKLKASMLDSVAAIS